MSKQETAKKEERGLDVKQSFSDVQIKHSAEMAGTAIAAAAKAEIEAGFIMGLKNPRNEDDARTQILDTCRNPRFAEKAMYAKPVGGRQIEGLSIRFAEEAVRLWGNTKVQIMVMYDDTLRRSIKVTVYDLQTNMSWSQDINVEKTVERKNAAGREVLFERTNSYGQKVAVVRATDDEIQNKINSLASKASRNGILRILPEHILDEAIDAIKKTAQKEIKEDPDAAKKKILDGLALVGVMPSEVEKYLGHKVKQITASEIEKLRQIYTGIKTSQTTWPEIMEAKLAERGKKKDVADRGKGFAKPGETKNHQSPR